MACSSASGMACSSASVSRAAAAAEAGGGSSSGKGTTVTDDSEGISRSETFFGISPVRLVDDVYNVTSVYIKRGLDQMEAELLEDQYTMKEPHVVKRGVSRSYQQLFSSLDKNVDKFEIYVVRNILKVPRHLDLSATAGGPGAISAPAQEEQLDADLEELRRKVHQAEFVNRAMEKKVQDLQEHVKQYQGIKAVFDEADKKLEEKSLPPLEALVSDVLYIDPEMRSLEKQYRVLEADRAKENTPMDMEAIDTHFARCKGNMGGASTRTMDQLGTLLGAR